MKKIAIFLCLGLLSFAAFADSSYNSWIFAKSAYKALTENSQFANLANEYGSGTSSECIQAGEAIAKSFANAQTIYAKLTENGADKTHYAKGDAAFCVTHYAASFALAQGNYDLMKQDPSADVTKLCEQATHNMENLAENWGTLRCSGTTLQ